MSVPGCRYWGITIKKIWPLIKSLKYALIFYNFISNFTVQCFTSSNLPGSFTNVILRTWTPKSGYIHLYGLLATERQVVVQISLLIFCVSVFTVWHLAFLLCVDGNTDNFIIAGAYFRTLWHNFIVSFCLKILR